MGPTPSSFKTITYLGTAVIRRLVLHSLALELENNADPNKVISY